MNTGRTRFKKGLVPWNKGRKGHKRPEGAAQKQSETVSRNGLQKMEKNNCWKGGKTKTAQGYILIKSPNHPFRNCEDYVMEQRLVLESYLGRFLKKSEVVHHINKILDDNRIENLVLFEDSKSHLNYHKSKGRITEGILFDGSNIQYRCIPKTDTAKRICRVCGSVDCKIIKVHNYKLAVEQLVTEIRMANYIIPLTDSPEKWVESYSSLGVKQDLGDIKLRWK